MLSLLAILEGSAADVLWQLRTDAKSSWNPQKVNQVKPSKWCITILIDYCH